MSEVKSEHVLTRAADLEAASLAPEELIPETKSRVHMKLAKQMLLEVR